MKEIWTIKKVLDWGAGYFSQNNVESPRLNIEHLLAELLRKKRIDLYVEFERQLTQEELAQLKEQIQRRVKGEPLQYILGQTDFYDSSFIVGPGVLIPRPETEILVDELLKRIQEKFTQPIQLIDIGTGSGNIALSLIKALHGAKAIAVDISQEAINLAQTNAEKLELTDRIQFFCGDGLKPLKATQLEPVEVIVSNPPYVTEEEFLGLDRQIKEFEPREALVAGKNGLEYYESFISEAPSFLVSGGILAFEVGKGQAQKVEEWISAAGFSEVNRIPDMAGIERVVIGIKK